MATIKIKRHHNEDLAHTKGRYYVTLHPKPGLISSDGHALTHDEGVVISCPGCGAPQGIGFDDVKIVDGKIDRPWTCYHCRMVVDSMEFEMHTDPAVREVVARKKEAAMNEIGESRIRRAAAIHRENELAELNDRVDREVRGMIPNPHDPDAIQKVIEDMYRRGSARRIPNV